MTGLSRNYQQRVTEATTQALEEEIAYFEERRQSFADRILLARRELERRANQRLGKESKQ